MTLGMNPVTLLVMEEDSMKKRFLRVKPRAVRVMRAVMVSRLRRPNSAIAERILTRYRETFEILART